MTSKSWPVIDAFQRKVSGRRPALNSDTRKRGSDETYERPSKRSRTGPASLPCSWAPQEFGKKRKSDEETTESRKRSKTFPVTDSSEQPGPSSSGPVAPTEKAHFEAKYQEAEKLGSGTFGRVYAGFRRDDNRPVAIKHVDYSVVDYVHIGNEFIPTEVFLMQKVQPAQGQSSAAIALLDWYQLERELILVIERPVPCMNLWQYLLSKGRFLAEDEAKVIVRQLVDAAIDIHSKGVYHRDIKLLNILVETGSDVPRIRIIDFGCGLLLSKDKKTEPLYYFMEQSTAENETVKQIGEVAFDVLYGFLPFTSRIAVLRGYVPVKAKVSMSSRVFLERFFTFQDRSLTLESVKNDPWLQ